MKTDKSIIVQLNINTEIYKDAHMYGDLSGVIRCYFYPFALENLFAMNGISLGRILMHSHAVKTSVNTFWKSPISKNATEEEIITYLTTPQSPPHIKQMVDELTIKEKK